MKAYTHSWTGRKINPKRSSEDGRWEAQHSSASGWYVFDHETKCTVKGGLGSLNNALQLVRRLEMERAGYESAPLG